MTRFKSGSLKAILLVFMLGFSPITSSEILVLVHGYNSNGATWYKHGIIRALIQQGWQDGGSLLSHPIHGIFHRGPNQKLNYRTITVDLPSQAPIEIQSYVLNHYLNYLQQQEPQQTFSIIAHSAGGIVARHMLLQNQHKRIHRLITVASPHLGTGMAEVGEFIAKTPMGFMGPVVGVEDFNDSEILLNQLQREQPNTLLHWLNRQPHPGLEYISIVRSHGTFFNKDILVRAYSQDLRNVSGISKAISLPSYGDHELQYQDGILIARIVNVLPSN